MSVVVSMEEVGPCRKQLTVQVPAPAVEAETLRVVQELGRRAKVPGFRKGKVPPQVLRQRFKEDIEREVVDRLVPRYWKQAEVESQIDPLLPPEVEQVDLLPGEPLTFVASVDTRPEIRLGNIRDFDLPDIDVQISEPEVVEALEDLRRRAADWVPVERTAGNGDRIVAEITEAGADDQAIAEPQVMEFEVGEERVWEELSLAVAGLAAGQETAFSHREGEASRERDFRVKVVAVKERELPPLDDDFASRVGDFDTLKALRGTLEERLLAIKTEERRQQRERNLLEQLRERHPIELPKRVVESEIEALLRQYAADLSRRGLDVERARLDWKKLAEKVRPQAESEVHARLLLDAVAEKESISVEEPEFEEALAAIARQQGETILAVQRTLDESGGLTRLRARLRREKTMRTLLGETPEQVEAATSGAGPSARGE